MSAENVQEPGAQLRSEEETLTKILHAKMKKQGCFQEGDQEPVAYRISEIMVAAKELYTKELPRLMSEDNEKDEQEMFSELAGLRMTFFHLRDLITDFDEAFLDAMTHQRDDDDDGEHDDEDEEDDEDEDEDHEEQDDSEESASSKAD